MAKKKPALSGEVKAKKVAKPAEIIESKIADDAVIPTPAPFVHKEIALHHLDAIKSAFPDQDVEFIFYPLSDNTKKITAKFKNGDAVVATGPTTLEAAKFLAIRLGVTL